MTFANAQATFSAFIQSRKAANPKSFSFIIFHIHSNLPLSINIEKTFVKMDGLLNMLYLCNEPKKVVRSFTISDNMCEAETLSPQGPTAVITVLERSDNISEIRPTLTDCTSIFISFCRLNKERQDWKDFQSRIASSYIWTSN